MLWKQYSIMKFALAVFVLLVAAASAFVPVSKVASFTALKSYENERGAIAPVGKFLGQSTFLALH
jgi:hypothetical protein